EKVLVTPGALRDQLGRPGGLAVGGQTRIGRQDSAQLVAGAAALLPLAAIIVDADGNVVDINHQASQLFGLGGAEIGRPFRDLDAADEELQSTVEELETTNEELQSTNEELETTNEELQSTNEELETMNEELQSTNDELETVNEDHSARALELDRVNMFLEGLL